MVRDIIPWRRKKEDSRLARRGRNEDHPLEALHREMDQLFEDFFGNLETGLSWPRWSGLRSQSDAWTLNVDVAEDDNEIRVSADVPGMEEKDIDVELSDNLLTIKGEKNQERDEKKPDYHVVERSYGSFHRSIPLPGGLEQDKAKARFKKGVLTITVPKSAQTKTSRKQIPISAD